MHTRVSPSSARRRASAASPAPSWRAPCTHCTERVCPQRAAGRGWEWGAVRGAGPDPAGRWEGCSRSSAAYPHPLPRGPSQYCPRPFLLWLPPQVGATPTLRFPACPGARDQNAGSRTEPRAPTFASPSPISQAAPSSLPTWGHSAKVSILKRETRSAEETKDRADGAEAGQQMGRDWQAAEAGVEWELNQKEWGQQGQQQMHPGVADRAPRSLTSCPLSRSSAGPLRPPAGLASQPLEQMRPSKLPSSPPTLVQKHPSSPSPACFQRCAMKSLYK